MVDPTPEALLGLRRCSLRGRDPRLPIFYQYDGRHPLRPAVPPDEAHGRTEISERTFVYFVDPTIEGKQRARELGDLIKVPYGRLDSMNARAPGTTFEDVSWYKSLTWLVVGLIELVNGDWLLARDAKGDGDPMKDIFQGFVLGRYAP